jgi:6-pyruvoyltetrahydropterin/6-carboxytetrahydropterin synthase
MNYRTAATFGFEVAHWTPIYPDDHPNRRLHGHSYVAELIAEGPLDPAGMVVSAERLAVLADVLRQLVDHQCLNEIDGLAQPTMEALAAFFLVRARLNIEQVNRVRVGRPTLRQWAEAWV